MNNQASNSTSSNLQMTASTTVANQANATVSDNEYITYQMGVPNYKLLVRDNGDGEEGATFTPIVDDKGNLTWTNNKGLRNPSAFSIPKNSMVVDGEYDSVSGTITLTLSNGKTMVITVSELISDIITRNEFNTKKAEMDETINGKVDEAYVEDGYLILQANGQTIARLTGFGGSGGGGGGSSSNAKLTATKAEGSQWNSTSIAEITTTLPITITWSSIEDEQPTGDGTLQVLVNGVIKKTRNISQGNVTEDVRSYLSVGTHVIKFIVKDTYENTKRLSWTVSVEEISLASTFSDSSIFTAGSDLSYTYTPNCAAEKTIYFKLDNEQIGTYTTEISSRQLSYKIEGSKLTHGHHIFEAYFIATIDGNTVTSNTQRYDLICVDGSSHVPIIASTFNKTEATQYFPITIKYKVYNPDQLQAPIQLLVNGTAYGQSLTVDRTEQTWTYIPTEATAEEEYLTLGIQCVNGGYDVQRTFSLTVEETTIDVHAETEGLQLYLTSFGRSNNESEESRSTWSFTPTGGTAISSTLSDFNFVSDGWKLDDDDLTVLKVTGDARVTIPFKIFETDFKTTGKTIEFEFSTQDVLNYDTTIISCINGSDDRGIKVTPQKVTLKSEQSSISTQYKENEHVRIAFTIQNINENRLILCYINGIISGIIQYPAGDSFVQLSPVNISIGSNDCTVNLYNIRIYNHCLTRYQTLNNWIADTANGIDKLNRYNHNNIYDSYGNISMSKLPSDLPYLVLQGTELPTFKGDKKTIAGYYVDPEDATKSFSFTSASIDVQGTSSQFYPRKNWKIKFSNGFEMTSSGAHKDKYALRENSIEENVFCFKADVASSEGANNVELVRLYNDICPYSTPPQEENEYVRQGIDGFPIVIFYDDGSGASFMGKYNFNNDKSDESTFGFEDGDESWETLNNALAVAQFKSVPAVTERDSWFEGFESRFPDYDNPSSEAVLTNLHALATWINSTDTTVAPRTALAQSVTYNSGVVFVDISTTDPTTREVTYSIEKKTLPFTLDSVTYNSWTYTLDSKGYRATKFYRELGDHFHKDDVIFYYVFTELFLMIDSRVKNSFPTLYQEEGTSKWCFLPYDMDTAIGINNEGALVFDYHLEDTDTVSGFPVYNGQDSVLWNNVRICFQEDIEEMYQDLRTAQTNPLSYNEIETRYEDHQDKWPEAIFNEDAYYKYINPLISESSSDYLYMCQGSKAEQRKWWLWNRFRYLDSKYNTGDAQSQTLTFRAHSPGYLTITPYADIYARLTADSVVRKARAERNVATVLDLRGLDFDDAIITVYSADQLKSIGDLSAFIPGTVDVSKATKLETLKVGSDAVGYQNEKLESLTLGNNVLLRTLDVRNCINLDTAIDISNCISIEKVYFDNTQIKSVTLPDGSMIDTLHLPETITSLKLVNQTKLTDFKIGDDDSESV